MGCPAWSFYAAVACGLVGCLDAGGPPLGRHLLAGRDQERVYLAAVPAGGAARILVTHRHATNVSSFTTTRVSLVDDPIPAVGPQAARTVIDDEGGSSTATNCTASGCRPPADALGRLFFSRATFSPGPFPGTVGELDELVRVDPTTGEEESFGATTAFALSPAGTRFAFLLGADGSRRDGFVVELDGTRTALPSSRQLAFFGEDLLLVDDKSTLMHVPPGSSAPSPVATDVISFSAFHTQRGDLVLLQRHVPPAAPTTSLFDPTTLLETALPPTTALATTFVPSPSGRYLVARSGGDPATSDAPPPPGTPSDLTLSLYDRDTGAELTMMPGPLPATQRLRSPVWRPHPEEAWFVLGDDLWRWQPGNQPVVATSGPDLLAGGAPYIAISEQEPRFYDSPSFTPDGRFRVVTAADFSQTGPVFLQSADDAAAPPFLLNPVGTGLAGVWPLADGRLLVEAWIGDPNRNDVYLEDPVAGTSRPLTSTGNVLAVGGGRFLALQHWVAGSSSGDLTLIDSETGAATLIAENVYAVALDISEALAPGTRVVFLVRSRIASPYDGCWAAELP
jgi:hypothetical protein